MASPLDKYAGEGIGGNEEAKKLENNFEELIQKYASSYDWSSAVDDFEELKSVKAVLSPLEISALSQALILKNISRSHAGIFLSRLIQNSYDSGHNDFTIMAEEPTSLDHLGYKLKGGFFKPLKITLKGYAMRYAVNASYLDFTIKGDVHSHSNARHCTFTFDEKTYKSTFGRRQYIRALIPRNTVILDTPTGKQKLCQVPNFSDGLVFLTQEQADNMYKTKPYKKPGLIRRLLKNFAEGFEPEP